jgi:lysozyme
MEPGLSPRPAGVQGIDVSHYQRAIDWGLVAKAGLAFAFIKATEGTSDVDPQFQANWSGANAAGLLRGAYHFYQPGADPHQQAAAFLSVVRPGPGDLPPALDVETTGDTREIIAGIQVWLAAVEQASGKAPILYTNPSFWARLGASGFGRFPLWIANYGVASPTVPEGWPTWTFWQFSESGSVSGIEGPVDLDLYQGTFQDLSQSRLSPRHPPPQEPHDSAGS